MEEVKAKVDPRSVARKLVVSKFLGRVLRAVKFLPEQSLASYLRATASDQTTAWMILTKPETADV